MERVVRLSKQFKSNQTASALKSSPTQRSTSPSDDFSINDNSKLLLDFKVQMSLLMHQKSMMIISKDVTERFVETESVRLSDYASQTLNTSAIFFVKPSLLRPSADNVKSPKEGWFYVKMPFSVDESLQFRFSNIDNTTMRNGKILELMDYCAGITSYRQSHSWHTKFLLTYI